MAIPKQPALMMLTLLLLSTRAAEPGGRKHAATVDDLLALDVRPFAIAHRGFGANLGEDPSRPIENTVANNTAAGSTRNIESGIQNR